MRWLEFNLTGYIGIYDGIGMKSINVPFYNCKHNICLIVGPNGSGKSTLESALTVLPDSPSCFMSGEPAAKSGKLIADDGTIYSFSIEHPIDGNGNRKQAKAFFFKNGEDLNPNGNITSYKEIVESEFMMDPNFLSLTRLSIEDRGITDKSPAERKKYIVRMISSLDTYNAMHKALSKKSSIFKSHINSIIAKMNNIDLSTADIELHSIDQQIAVLESHCISLQAEMAKHQQIIDSVNNSAELQDTYDRTVDELDKVTKMLNALKKKAGSIDKEYDSIEAVDAAILVVKDAINKNATTIEYNENEIKSLMSRIYEIQNNIHEKDSKVNAMKSELAYEDLTGAIETLTNVVNTQKKILSENGLDGMTISKEEYKMIFGRLNMYRESIFDIYEIYSDTCITAAVNHVLEGTCPNIDYLEAEIKRMEAAVASISNEITRYEELMKSVDILNSRPDKCSIDTCPFIKKALNDAKENPKEKLEEKLKELSVAQDDLKKMNEMLSNARYINAAIEAIKLLISNIEESRSMLIKCKVADIFKGPVELLLDKIRLRYTFDEIKDCRKYIELADSIDGYNTNVETLNILIEKKKLYDSKNELIEEIAREISELYNTLKDAEDKVVEYNEVIASTNKVLDTHNDNLNRLESLKKVMLQIRDFESSRLLLTTKLNDVMEKLTGISDSIEAMNKLKSEYENDMASLGPLKKSREELAYSIKRAQEYSNELEEYQGKYDTVEILKKYSSPNKGIQTLYMNLYMNKTISIANEILGYIFGESLELLPYIINEDEFRIPVRHSSGLISDDVSSCSSGQICMISVAITVALGMQASPVFNIYRFDEIEGSLDSSNRGYFINTVIRKLHESMSIQQLIMVSHAIEANTMDVDVIRLGYIPGLEHEWDNANLIADFATQTYN